MIYIFLQLSWSKNSYVLSQDKTDLVIAGDVEITQEDLRDGRDHKLFVNVVINDGVPGVGVEAFGYCSNLVSIYLPPTIQYLESKAFFYCSKLTYVNFSEGISTLKDSIFFGSGITKLKFPKSLVNIDFSFLSYASPLSYISFDEENSQWTTDENYQFVLTKDRKTAVMCVNSPGDLYLPSYVEILQSYFANSRLNSLKFFSDSNLTTVQSLAFRQSYIKSISFPSKLTSLGSNVFWMGHLEYITLPASLIYLNVAAFDTLATLKSVTVDPGNPAYMSQDGILYDINLTKILFIPPVRSNLTLPGTIVEISGSTIQSSALEDVYIFGSKKFKSHIGVLYQSEYQILFACPGRKLDVTVHDDCTTINSNAFIGCSLRSISFGNSKISQIGSMGFSSCKNLVSISLSPYLTKLGAYAFAYSNALSGKIKFYSELTEINDCIFIECGEIDVDMSECDKIISLSHNLFGNSKLISIKLPPNLEVIETNCFANTQIESIDFGLSLKSIGESAFQGCVHLSNISRWGEVNSIDDFAFSKTGFVAISMPSTTLELRTNVLSECPELKEIIFEEDSLLQSVKIQAFQRSNRLKKVQFGKNVIKIADSAFAYTYGLTEIIISPMNPIYRSENGIVMLKKSNQIDYEIFVGIGGGIANATIPYTVGDIYNKSFHTCSNIVEVLFSTTESKNSSLTQIKSYLFVDCVNLRRVVIPNSILKICTESFCATTSLIEFEISNNQRVRTSSQKYFPLLNSIERKAFQGCSSLKKINLEKCINLIYIEPESFRDCTSLAIVILPNNLKELQSQCFFGCIQLESIRLPGSLSNLESESFGYCGRFQFITYCGIISINTTNVFVGTKAKIAKVPYGYPVNLFCGLPVTKIYDADCNIASQFFTGTTKSQNVISVIVSLTCDINDNEGVK